MKYWLSILAFFAIFAGVLMIIIEVSLLGMMGREPKWWVGAAAMIGLAIAWLAMTYNSGKKEDERADKSDAAT